MDAEKQLISISGINDCKRIFVQKKRPGFPRRFFIDCFCAIRLEIPAFAGI
jgi:hypothetical protein